MWGGGGLLGLFFLKDNLDLHLNFKASFPKKVLELPTT